MIGTLIALLLRIVLILACGVFAAGMVLIGIRYPFIALFVLGWMAWRRMRAAKAPTGRTARPPSPACRKSNGPGCSGVTG